MIHIGKSKSVYLLSAHGLQISIHHLLRLRLKSLYIMIVLLLLYGKFSGKLHALVRKNDFM